MKNLVLLSACLLAASLTHAQSKLPDLDVSANKGFPYILKAPAGAKAEDKYGDLYVTLGTSFETTLSVSDAAYDVAKRKAEIKGNTMNKLKRWVVEAADGGIYQSEIMGQQQFHFVHTMKIGSNYLTFEDHKSGDVYTQAQIQAMYDAVKATRAK